jgi:hypothetical protein
MGLMRCGLFPQDLLFQVVSLVVGPDYLVELSRQQEPFDTCCEFLEMVPGLGVDWSAYLANALIGQLQQVIEKCPFVAFQRILPILVLAVAQSNDSSLMRQLCTPDIMGDLLDKCDVKCMESIVPLFGMIPVDLDGHLQQQLENKLNEIMGDGDISPELVDQCLALFGTH